MSTASSSLSSASPEPARYSGVVIALHWVLALALLGMVGFGLYMADLPFSPARLKLYNWHKWAGVCVLVLSLARLLWRFTHRPPELPAAMQAAMPAWQKLAHHGTHAALYALFFAIPLLGWAYSSAAGFPIVVFGVLPLPDWVPVSPDLAEALKPLHKWAALTLTALVGLHVAAVVKHQLLDRDGLLWRMWPGRRG